MKFEPRQKLIIWTVVLVGFLQGLFYAYTMIPFPDQMQLFTKGARLAFMGHWTHYGNAITGGGYNPGSLTTALVGIPLMIWDSPWAFDLMISILQLFALYLLVKSVDDDFKPPEILALICLFWLSPWRASNASLWNPSYVIFPAALHIYTAKRLFAAPSFAMTLLHIGALGFAFQIHPSFIVLAFISAFMFLRGQLKLNWPAAGLGILLCLLSLVPFYRAIQIREDLIPVVNEEHASHMYYGRGLIMFFPMLKGIFYWPRFSSAIFPSYIFSHVDFSALGVPWLSSALEYLFTAVRYAVGVPSFLLALAGFFWLLKRIYQSRKQKWRFPDFLSNYLLAALAAVTFASALSPISFSNWHLLIVLPFSTVSFVIYLFRGLPSTRWAMPITSGLSIYYIVYNLLAVYVSDYRSITNNIHARYPELKQIILTKPSYHD